MPKLRAKAQSQAVRTKCLSQALQRRDKRVQRQDREIQELQERLQQLQQELKLLSAAAGGGGREGAVHRQMRWRHRQMRWRHWQMSAARANLTEPSLY